MELQYIIVFLLKNRRIDSHHLSFIYENKKVFDLVPIRSTIQDSSCWNIF